MSFSPAVAIACCGASAIRVSVFFFLRADTIYEEEDVRYGLVGGEAADGYHRVRTLFPSTLTISKGYEKITFILGGYLRQKASFSMQKDPACLQADGIPSKQIFFQEIHDDAGEEDHSAPY